MNARTKIENPARGTSANREAAITFDAIHEPGAYLCHWSGHLLRVPKEVTNMDHSARMSLVSKEKLYVTPIGGDPEIPLPKARALARETGVPIAF